MIGNNMIEYAADGAAWKTPSMKGYIKKTVLAAETYGEGAYKLTFVKADGTSYDFYFNVDTSVFTGTIPDASNLTFDRELLGHVIDNNWIAGTAAEFEAARSGTGTW